MDEQTFAAIGEKCRFRFRVYYIVAKPSKLFHFVVVTTTIIIITNKWKRRRWDVQERREDDRLSTCLFEKCAREETLAWFTSWTAVRHDHGDDGITRTWPSRPRTPRETRTRVGDITRRHSAPFNININNNNNHNNNANNIIMVIFLFALARNWVARQSNGFGLRIRDGSRARARALNTINSRVLIYTCI